MSSVAESDYTLTRKFPGTGVTRFTMLNGQDVGVNIAQH